MLVLVEIFEHHKFRFFLLKWVFNISFDGIISILISYHFYCYLKNYTARTHTVQPYVKNYKSSKKAKLFKTCISLSSVLLSAWSLQEAALKYYIQYNLLNFINLTFRFIMKIRNLIQLFFFKVTLNQIHFWRFSLFCFFTLCFIQILKFWNFMFLV